MQLYQRAYAVPLILFTAGCLTGCGGPGTPVPGGADAATEAANAAFAPEGGPADDAAGEGSAAATETTSSESATPETAQPATEESKDASPSETEAPAN